MHDDLQTRIAHLWQRLVQALGPAGQTLRVRPGRAALPPVEDRIGLRLPDDYRAWLALHDGEDDVRGRVEYLPGGGFLLPADVTLQRWVDQEAWFQGEDDPGYAVFQDDDRIRSVVAHPQRVMIASNRYGDGDNTYLDFCPGPAGTAGQVIVATSECDFEVVGASFEDFLRRLATALEEGLLEVLPAQGGEGPRVAARVNPYDRWESVLRAVTSR
jgi:cell wall assembly regulator SMI1